MIDILIYWDAKRGWMTDSRRVGKAPIGCGRDTSPATAERLVRECNPGCTVEMDPHGWEGRK